MRQKTLAIFAAITLIVVAAAFLVQSGRVGPTARSGGDRLFPDFAERLNDAGSITVTAKGESFTIARDDGVWRIDRRGGYPARIETVRKTLIGLADARTFEAKTSNPDSYSRIEVDDPVDEDANSVRITVKDGDGAELASLIVGKKRYARGGFGATMTYVRKAGDAQSWLAETDLDIGDDPIDWIDKKLLDIVSERVSRITFVQPDGKRLVIERAEAKTDGETDGEADGVADGFTIRDLAADAEIKSESEVNSRASALMSLELEDVRRATEIPFLEQSAGVAEYALRDGLVLRLTLARYEERTWLAMEALVDEDSRVDEVAPNAPKEPDESKENGDGGEDSDALPSLEAVRKEAEAINARARGWAYVVPGYKLDQFKTRLADLLKADDKDK